MKRFNVFLTIILSLFLLLSCRGNDEPSNYTISFETNCEKIVDDKIVNAGDNYIIDFELTYMDWTLEGWYYDIELTNPYDPLKPITSNITLYASWAIPIYDVYHKVYFNANGGTYRYSLDVISNDTLDLDDIPTKRNHTFLGWYLDEDLTVIFDLNTIITSDITLYAKWEITKYTLSYETFGGTNIEPTQDYITESTTTPISPEKVGAEF
ncbi:MAG: InlB B-repeat-containing protein, partial [Acholeplasmatales bacterium]|nr:InlB B-repeat-containing protein [Acholeplasmatales bacterium]